MSNKLHTFAQKFVPYIILGIVIAAAIAILIMFSYLLLWGILIGAIIGSVAFIKNYFFPVKKSNSSGRIIDYNDNDKV